MEGSYSRNGRGWISISDEHCPTLFSVHCLYRFPREGSTLLAYNEPPEKQQWKHLHQNIIFYYWSYFCVMCMNITGGIHNSTCCSSRQHTAGVGCTCDQSLFSCWRLLCYHSACLHGQLTTHSWKLLTIIDQAMQSCFPVSVPTSHLFFWNWKPDVQTVKMHHGRWGQCTRLQNADTNIEAYKGPLPDHNLTMRNKYKRTLETHPR